MRTRLASFPRPRMAASHELHPGRIRLFLDSSVLLAAAGSSTGASRRLFLEAPQRGWQLETAHYACEETLYNLPKLGPSAEAVFHTHLAPSLRILPTTIVVSPPLVHPVSKDRPILATALASRPTALLTLDRADFQDRLGPTLYGLPLLTPGDWLQNHL